MAPAFAELDELLDTATSAQQPYPIILRTTPMAGFETSATRALPVG